MGWVTSVPGRVNKVVGFLGALVGASALIYFLLPPLLTLTLTCKGGNVDLAVKNWGGPVTIGEVEIGSVSQWRFGHPGREPLTLGSDPLTGHAEIGRWETGVYEWPGEWNPLEVSEGPACTMDARVRLASHPGREWTDDCVCER